MTASLDFAAGPDSCDVCGSADLEWRKCKQVCRACGSIVRSCADLGGASEP